MSYSTKFMILELLKFDLIVEINYLQFFRPRKLLRNILVVHEGLEVLLEIIETEWDSKSNDFSEAVLSISNLAGHIGVVAPNLTLNSSNVTRSKSCCYQMSENEFKDVELVGDDGGVRVNRGRVCASSEVFAVMLDGSFAEAQKNSVSLPKTSKDALLALVHYLYGCRRCPGLSDLRVTVLLELVSLSDKYLLKELNRQVWQEIVERCLDPDQVVCIYEHILQGEYPVREDEGDDYEETAMLNTCAVSYLMVGAFKHEVRVNIFRQLASSKMKTDFVDDIGKILRDKLLEVR